MPIAPRSPCRVSTCPALASYHGYCDRHKEQAPKGKGSTERGYGYKWQQVRIGVLREAGIPRELWPDYDVDHNPPYDALIEPDHNKYTLIPRLHTEHSVKTWKQGRGMRKRAPRGWHGDCYGDIRGYGTIKGNGDIGGG